MAGEDGWMGLADTGSFQHATAWCGKKVRVSMGWEDAAEVGELGPTWDAECWVRSPAARLQDTTLDRTHVQRAALGRLLPRTEYQG